MTDKQPEALRLADWLERDAARVAFRAAAELRRLHALNLEWEAKVATWLAGDDRLIANRRAITSAAAEIGRNMK